MHQEQSRVFPEKSQSNWTPLRGDEPKMAVLGRPSVQLSPKVMVETLNVHQGVRHLPPYPVLGGGGSPNGPAAQNLVNNGIEQVHLDPQEVGEVQWT